MNTNWNLTHMTLSSSDKELIRYADFAVRHGDYAEAVRSLEENVRYMDDIDAGFAMLEMVK